MAKIDDATYVKLKNYYGWDAAKASKVKAQLESWKYDSSMDKIMNKLNWNNTYTGFTSTTNKKVTQNTNPGWTGTDLSYVKPSAYYWSWTNWDYQADITKDKNRQQQMKENLWSDMVTNPGLFKNRADYNKYYNYDKRSASQKALLDEFYNNANKYGWDSTEQYYADMASQAATDKNNAKLKRAAETYSTLLPQLNAIRQKMDDRLGPLFDQLQEMQTKYLQDNAYLRKLQMQYNKGMVEAAGNRAAGQAASMWSMMSAQWLSQSAIASSMMWAEKTWVEELNRIQDQHITRMKELSDAEADFKKAYVDWVKWLTDAEQWYLKDWYNSFKVLQDNYDNVYNTMIDEKYAPYEAITWARLSWTVEASQADAKRKANETNYKNWDVTDRLAMIRAYMQSFLWEEANSEKYLSYMRAAAQNSSDLTWAFEYLAKVTWNKKIASVPSTVPPTVVDPDEDNTTTFDFSKISSNSLNKYKK